MKLSYKAINEKGEIVEASGEAESKFELNNQLKENGQRLVSATEIKETGFKSRFHKLQSIGTVSTHSKIIFARNIGSMIEAGLPMSRALAVMERQAKNKKLKKVIQDIGADIKTGKSFSDALANHPKIFPNILVAMVKAGEESGNLVGSLDVVSSQMEKSYVLKKKIQGAMIYPGVIVSAMIIIGIFMMIFVVPTLTKTFEELKIELPLATRMVIGLSNFLQNNIILTVLIFILLIVSLIIGIKTKKGRKIIDFVLLHTPAISIIFKSINSARTTRTLSSLLTSGVPYTQALKITEDVMQSEFYKKVIIQAERNVELGLPVSDVFQDNTKYYPPFVAEMIAVGEETGDLGKMLMKVASYYEDDVDQKTKNMSTIIEPILMILVGVAVGFFAISMISPMYSIVGGI